MRQIKFRAWNKTEKRWLKDEGTFLYLDGRVFSCQDGNCITAHCKQVGQNIALMQFTGLLDKNGIEIFEEDIVKTFRRIRIGRGYKPNLLEAVNYSNITARWYPLDITVTEECEIVGNIYENPELLGANP